MRHCTKNHLTEGDKGMAITITKHGVIPIIKADFKCQKCKTEFYSDHVERDGNVERCMDKDGRIFARYFVNCPLCKQGVEGKANGY